MTAKAIEALEPAALWDYFEQLSRIPRESKNEKAAGDFVVRVARELGLAYARDAAGNIVVRKPASHGREAAASLCLQGHLDMVCVTAPGRKHDFARDPISLVRTDGWIGADGTTLGADNGLAVATCLAIMANPALEHGPLELLFTIDEETGLTGARELSPELLTSRTLINLDSEDEVDQRAAAQAARTPSAPGSSRPTRRRRAASRWTCASPGCGAATPASRSTRSAAMRSS